MFPVDNPPKTLLTNNWHQDLLNIVRLLGLILPLCLVESLLLEALEDLSSFLLLFLRDIGLGWIHGILSWTGIHLSLRPHPPPEIRR